MQNNRYCVFVSPTEKTGKNRQAKLQDFVNKPECDCMCRLDGRLQHGDLPGYYNEEEAVILLGFLQHFPRATN